MARLSKDSVAVWRGGTAFDVTSGSGHSLRTDGDAREAQSPMELLLAALIGCIGADVISILQKKRQAVTEMVVQVHGDRSEEHPRVYTEIKVNFIVTGRGIDPEAVRRAIDLAETKYCSVSATLRGTAKMIVSWEVHEAAPEHEGDLADLFND